AIAAARAALEAEAGLKEAAKRTAERCDSLGGSGWTRALLGWARLRLGEDELARAEFGRALSAEKLPWVHIEKASLERKRGQFAEAVRHLERASRLLPQSGAPDLLAAEIHLDQARYSSARRSYAAALRKEPAAETYHQMARVSVMEGRLDLAERAIAAACRLD